MIFLAWIYYPDYYKIIKELNKYFKIIKHKYKLFKQNYEFQIEKEKQEKFYENKKEEIRKNTEIRTNKMINEKKEEMQKIEKKYQSILVSLDNIKTKDDLINFLNNLKELSL